ncbi:carbohydrate ABC transporter permease [Weissella minor]|uniref:Glycerol-3-phosphate ABC transporter permease n=1 Tax=Weissella minor TaxID=1620 RepID=A0A0R2JK56_9LACO|nr:sugar ABC transporter permease [Weissella minor]KRN77630.1 glycerol-3-phosphate ABC transporter permease [Weissella minor]
MHKRQNLLAFGLLFPSILVLGTFVFYPMIKTFWLSTQTTDLMGNPINSVGFKNFTNLFNSEIFRTSITVTLIFVLVTTVVTVVLAYWLAILASSKLKGIGFFRTIFSATMGISVTVASILWLFMFNPQIGMFSRILAFLHLPDINWLSDPVWALVAIIGTTVWMNLGFSFLILLGAVQAIPEDLYQVADLNGASKWLRLTKITLPATEPTVFFVTVVTLINAFQTFGQVDILTAGGPDYHTNLLVYSIYQDAFVNHAVGRASAESVVLTVIIMVVTFIQFYLNKRKAARYAD